jgi:methylmalonyl-CoA/ethylmalonyl-CoA epimerase
LFTRIDHVAVVCADLDSVSRHYQRRYGFQPHHEESNASQGIRESVLRLPGDETGAYLQLLQPTRADSTVSRWLARRGPGLHHVAFATPDVDAAAARIARAGARLLFDPPRPASMGSRATFLHPGDSHGVLVELVT